MPSGRKEPVSAVLVPVFTRREGAAILLCARPERAGDPYSGQICLPGGRREPEDASLRECALRETEEEVGLTSSELDIFCELDWHETRGGHQVKPFAARVRPGATPVPSPDEVRALLWLPCSRLTPDLFRVRGVVRDSRGDPREILSFHLDGHEVWGLTARVLRSLLAAGLDWPPP